MRCKICPACGTQNAPSSMECGNCGYDLMGVSAVDPEEEQRKAQVEEARQTEISDTGNDADEKPDMSHDIGHGPELVRVCLACGEMNPPQARKCQKCHEDISDILPSPRESEKRLHYRFEQIGTNYIYSIPCGTLVIGRENEMRDALRGKSYVSRVHAKLTVADGKLYIENLSTTNHTYVNNERIPDGRVELKPGDEVGLGGAVINGNRQDNAAYFLVGLVP